MSKIHLFIHWANMYFVSSTCQMLCYYRNGNVSSHWVNCHSGGSSGEEMIGMENNLTYYYKWACVLNVPWPQQNAGKNEITIVLIFKSLLHRFPPEWPHDLGMSISKSPELFLMAIRHPMWVLYPYLLALAPASHESKQPQGHGGGAPYLAENCVPSLLSASMCPMLLTLKQPDSWWQWSQCQRQVPLGAGMMTTPPLAVSLPISPISPICFLINTPGAPLLLPITFNLLKCPTDLI